MSIYVIQKFDFTCKPKTGLEIIIDRRQVRSSTVIKNDEDLELDSSDEEKDLETDIKPEKAKNRSKRKAIEFERKTLVDMRNKENISKKDGNSIKPDDEDEGNDSDSNDSNSSDDFDEDVEESNIDEEDGDEEGGEDDG